MSKTYAVLGLGKFGGAIARELSELGFDVIAVDTDETLVNEVQMQVSYAVVADVTDKASMMEIGIGDVDAVFISIGDKLEASIMAALIAQELGVKNIIAKAANKMHGKLLSKIGVNRVIYPEREMGIRIAKSIVAGNFLDMIDLSSKYSLVELDVPQKWIGCTLMDIDARKNFGINVVAIKSGDEIIINFAPNYLFKENDVIVVIGSRKDIEGINND